VVNDKKPHSHIFKRVYSTATRVKGVELAHKVVEKFGSVPNCFGKMTTKRLECVVDVEKS